MVTELALAFLGVHVLQHFLVSTATEQLGCGRQEQERENGKDLKLHGEYFWRVKMSRKITWRDENCERIHDDKSVGWWLHSSMFRFSMGAVGFEFKGRVLIVAGDDFQTVK